MPQAIAGTKRMNRTIMPQKTAGMAILQESQVQVLIIASGTKGILLFVE